MVISLYSKFVPHFSVDSPIDEHGDRRRGLVSGGFNRYIGNCIFSRQIKMKSFVSFLKLMLLPSFHKIWPQRCTDGSPTNFITGSGMALKASVIFLLFIPIKNTIAMTWHCERDFSALHSHTLSDRLVDGSWMTRNPHLD